MSAPEAAKERRPEHRQVTISVQLPLFAPVVWVFTMDMDAFLDGPSSMQQVMDADHLEIEGRAAARIVVSTGGWRRLLEAFGDDWTVLRAKDRTPDLDSSIKSARVLGPKGYEP